MAADVTGAELAPTTPVPPAPAAHQPPPVAPYPHRPRFLFVYALLGVVLAGAIALVVIYAGRAITPAPKWSAWRPHGGGLGAAKQIADQVGKSYRLPNGDQLVDVLAKEPSLSPPSGSPIPLHYVALKGTGGKPDTDYVGLAVGHDDVSALRPRDRLLDRDGEAQRRPRDARPAGDPRARALYVQVHRRRQRRHCVHAAGQLAADAGDLLAQVRRSVGAEEPLDQTLRAKVPLPATIPAREVHTIDATTESRVYKVALAQAPNGDAVLVLTPLSA